MTKKNSRKRKTGGWAHTKKYPHENHPANYVRKVGDKIEYITFTHSPEVEHKADRMPPASVLKAIPLSRVRCSGLGSMLVTTIPMCDNVSKKEREANKQKGLMRFENRSYAYPVVFVGNRNSLHSEIVGEFEPVENDKELIKFMFDVLPRANVPVTGGKGQYNKQNGNKKSPK